MKEKLISYLESFVSKRRAMLIDDVVKSRTGYITVVLEDIYQSHNASAVLRSCECFGIQDVHIIENRNTYTINPDVAMGSFKWLDLHRYNQEKTDNRKNALKYLKNNKYRIVATTPHDNAVNLGDFNLEKGKIALLFGTELNGLTKPMLEAADEYLKIPIYGFTESLNISVSAAIILHYLTYNLKRSSVDWQYSCEEQQNLKLKWLKKSLKKGEVIEEKFLKESDRNYLNS